jgi:alkylation response protein AidB-like acyl-CoA dehydrogenase
MSAEKERKTAIKGGEFLVKKTTPEEVFTPEDWNEEQLMIKNTCKDFIEQEVRPVLDRLDQKEKGLMESLIEKCGELGILSLGVPEELGGSGMDFTTSMLATEATGSGHSFSVAMSAHNGIGTLPILYYGTEEQKQKYIPKLASGEWKGCYCLTEPGAGSDANSGRTKAVPSDDGEHYILNGQKMWITNGTFADVMTVFAKIEDDDNLSAFIVDGDSEGISINPEEEKMGIRGSSTCQIFFEDVKVPKENLLHERGKGFKIALNILNLGRIKLAGAVIGGSKDTIARSVKYANEREQFGHPIGSYGAIKYKLSEQAIRTFASEAATYRASQNIEDTIAQQQEEGKSKSDAILKGMEEYAAEAAMLKVGASEALDYVVDEGVQIHGGMGFSSESEVERAYRDSRINRIFEGTNEINRMLTVDMMLKRAMKGEIDLMGPAKKIQDELMSVPDFDEEEGGPLAAEERSVDNFKKLVLMVAGSAAQKYMEKLEDEQEILMNIADLAIETYFAESMLLRVLKMIDRKGEEASSIAIDMVRVHIHDAASRMNFSAKEGINAFAEGDELRMMQMGAKRFTKVDPFNTKAARRRIADRMLDKGGYPFE